MSGCRLNERKDMAYITAWSTDTGICKKTNQDSALVMQAESFRGDVLMAAVCDGVGGLAKGELASAYVAEQLQNWFTDELEVLLEEEDMQMALYHSWNRLIDQTNKEISGYAKKMGTHLGTTATVLLLVENTYFIMNIGDSRIYILTDQMYQLTHDQTLVQKEIDAGRLSLEDAMKDDRRSVLLQCIGASPTVIPDFFVGTIPSGSRYLLCSDGFRHEISPEEIYGKLSSTGAQGYEQMKKGLNELIELNKSRQETDNITAVLIQAPL